MHLAYISTNFPSLLIIFPSFFHIILNMNWTTPSFNCRYPLVHVHTSHQLYGYSSFTLCSWQWTHGYSWCSSWHLCCHHVRCWLPCGTKTTTCIFSSTFNSFHWRVDIVLTKNDIRTLANIVIANPTWVDFLPQSCAIQRSVASDAVQAKERSYRDWHPIDQFFPLAIEVFGCLHK